MIQAIGLTSNPRQELPPAVEDVSFEARTGRVTALLDAEPIGTTTALRLMLELQQGRGVTYFRGRPLHRIAYPSREVGVLMGDVPGHPARSVRGHLRMLCAAVGVPVLRADDVLEAVGLVSLRDERLGTLSRGMDRRLGLACALLADPHTLVLDRPGEGLSTRENAWLHGILRAHASQGGTVLFTTNDPKEAARTADRVVTQDSGHVVADQEAADFARTRLRPRVAVRTPHAARLGALLTKEARAAHRTIEVVKEDGNRLSVYGSTCADVGETAYRHGILIHQLATETGDTGPRTPPGPVPLPHRTPPTHQTPPTHRTPPTHETPPAHQPSPTREPSPRHPTSPTRLTTPTSRTHQPDPQGRPDPQGGRDRPGCPGRQGSQDREDGPDRQATQDRPGHKGHQGGPQDHQGGPARKERSNPAAPPGPIPAPASASAAEAAPAGTCETATEAQTKCHPADHSPGADATVVAEATSEAVPDAPGDIAAKAPPAGSDDTTPLDTVRSDPTPPGTGPLGTVPTEAALLNTAPSDPGPLDTVPLDAVAPGALPSEAAPTNPAPPDTVPLDTGTRPHRSHTSAGTGTSTGPEGTTSTSTYAPAPVSVSVSAPAPTPASALPPPITVRPGRSPLRPLRYEIRRLLGVGTGYFTLAAVLATSALFSVFLARSGHTPQPHLLAAWPHELPLPPAALGAGLLGALAFGDEFRHPALAADRGTVPRRLGLLGAKLLVAAATALLLSTLAVLSDAVLLHLVYGEELTKVPADWPSLTASWYALVTGCAWAGVLAAGVFRSTTAGLAAVLAVPIVVVPLVQKAVEGPAVRSAVGLPARLRDLALVQWPFGAERYLAAGVRMIAQPVGTALMLSLTALLCAYLLTAVRTRVR
ncbi:ATP-binding cassette domain-containing protein [Streptomyces sp. PA5.6]|uniref:ATP-binding cassette domain-containing protein n=1 Tax=Streptomyces sp. PA5.6 TaxID=3035651 RepID=UPI003904A3A0